MHHDHAGRGQPLQAVQHISQRLIVGVRAIDKGRVDPDCPDGISLEIVITGDLEIPRPDQLGKPKGKQSIQTRTKWMTAEVQVKIRIDGDFSTGPDGKEAAPFADAYFQVGLASRRIQATLDDLDSIHVRFQCPRQARRPEPS